MNPVSYLSTGVLACDDNLRQLSRLPDNCVDLIYLDPPFFSNKNYEVIWGDEAEVRSFEDRWEGGINVYIDWMRQRVQQMHRVLKPTGSLYLHCDGHAGHYLKVMLDGVFGYSRYRNEVVWHYRRWTGAANSFLKMHDTIFFYTKTDTYTFNKQFTDYTEASKKRKKNHHTRIKGEDVYVTSVDPRGVAENDVWQIPLINSQARERMGYPTQKPVELLRKIICASSNKGDIVLDPFAGCGTTLVAAHEEGREWIGFDISPTAVNLMKKRMARIGAEPDVQGLPMTVDDLKVLKPFEFQNWVIQQVHGTHSPRKSNDMGIDGFSFMEQLPIQVKQSESVGRNVVDNFETALERAGHNRGYIIAFSFTRNAYEEVARAKSVGKATIFLVKIEDMLKVSHLVESANLLDLAHQIDEKDLASPVPDLMGLFSAYKTSGVERPLPKARAKKDLPSPVALIQSDTENESAST